jgi:hypothetical protein
MNQSELQFLGVFIDARKCDLLVFGVAYAVGWETPINTQFPQSLSIPVREERFAKLLEGLLCSLLVHVVVAIPHVLEGD